MSNPDKIFKEKLFDLETPLGGSVSFEKVMARRNKSAFPVWFKPAVFVVATLSVVSLTGFFLSNQEGSTSFDSNQSMAKDSNHGQKVSKNQSNISNKNQNTQTLPAAKNAIINSFESKSKAAVRNSRIAEIPEVNAKPTITIAAPEVNTSAERNNFSSLLKTFGIRLNELRYHLKSAGKISGMVHSDFNFKNKSCIPELELMLNTGGSNSGFSGPNSFSVRGNHYFGQYSAIALWNAPKGIQFGAGFGYSQFMGNGEWRSLNEFDKQTIDTQYITIIQPGMPNKVVAVYDTNSIHVKEVTTGNLNYRLTKLSVPLAIRFHTGEGRTILRFSGTIAPGMLSSANGELFNKTSKMNIDRNSTNNFTLDAKLGVGIHYLITRNIAVIAEPGLMYQSVYGNNWQNYNRLSLGFGLGLVFKP